MSLPKLKGIPKGIACLSMVGLLSLMFAAPAVATAGHDENPSPAGSVSFVQPSCTVDHVVVNIIDATPPPPEAGPGYAGIFYYLVSSRGAESQTPDSVDRQSSFALNSQPMAFGETVTFTVKAQLDTPEGSPPLVVIDSFTATRSSNGCEPPPVTCQSGTAGLTGSAVVVGNTVTYKASLPKNACADTWVANGDTYRVADTYDGSGNFNASSTPQHFFSGTRVDLVIKKGEKNVTEVRKLPVSCWWVQADTYTGKKIDIVGPGGHGGQFLGGGLKKLSDNKCEIQPPVVVINPSGKVTVDCKGSGTAAFDNSKSTTQFGFELVVNGNATLYSVSAGAVKQQSFSGAKPGSKVVVQDGEANELSSVVVAKCAIKPPTTVVVVPRPTTNLPVPTKVQTEGGELMSSETSGSGVLPFIVGFGFLIVGGLTLKLRRREARN